MVRIAIGTAAVALIVAGLGISYWLSSAPPRNVNAPLSPAVELPRAQYIEGVVAAAPKPPPAKAPAPPIVVNTYSHNVMYPLADWQIESLMAGWLDTVEVRGAPLEIGGLGRLQSDDILHARGWAGDPQLGMRLPYVLLVICDAVVAGVPVNKPRSDVAAAVHPNLGNSGWHAALFVGDLPRCNSMTLRAYGVSVTRRVFPLSGQFALTVTEAGEASTKEVERVAAEIRPQDIPEELPSATISIQAARANLRRCGDTACAVVGSLPSGKYTVAILDESPDWVLVFADGGVGWLARRLAVGLAPAVPRSAAPAQ